MSNPDKATEPNMDDILASIRKLIADEPPALRAGQDARAVNRLIEPLSPSPFLSVDTGTNREPRLPPPVDRLSDALRAMPAQTVHTPGFDDDLADLLDGAPAPPPEASASSSAAAPRAAARAEPAAPKETLAIDPWSSLRNLRSEPVVPKVNGAEVQSPAPAAPTVATAGKREAPAAAPAGEETRAAADTTDAIAQALAAAVSQSGATEEIAAETPSVLPSLVLPAPDAPVVAPGSPGTVAAVPPAAPAPMFPRLPLDAERAANGVAPAAAAKSAPMKMPSPVVPLTPAEASMHAAAVSALMAKAALEPAPGAQGAQGGVSRGPGQPARFPFDPVPGPAALADSAVKAAPLEPLAPPAAMLEPVAPASTDAAAAALDTQAAAASALGALAAGLAASSLGSSKMPEQGPTFAAPDQPKRAIEDIVTDMVRPMLEKWIAENMPRIVEKALRGEAKSKKV